MGKKTQTLQFQDHELNLGNVCIVWPKQSLKPESLRNIRKVKRVHIRNVRFLCFFVWQQLLRGARLVHSLTPSCVASHLACSLTYITCVLSGGTRICSPWMNSFSCNDLWSLTRASASRYAYGFAYEHRLFESPTACGWWRCQAVIFVYLSSYHKHSIHQASWSIWFPCASLLCWFFFPFPKFPQEPCRINTSCLLRNDFKEKPSWGENKRGGSSKNLLSDCPLSTGFQNCLRPWLSSPVRGVQGTWAHIPYGSCCCDRMPSRNNLREEGFILVHSSGDTRCYGWFWWTTWWGLESPWIQTSGVWKGVPRLCSLYGKTHKESDTTLWSRVQDWI